MIIFIESHRPEDRARWNALYSSEWSIMGAIQWAAHSYHWARGWTDHERGCIWPFNPEMIVTVDGVTKRACEWAAELLGGNYAAVLEQEKSA